MDGMSLQDPVGQRPEFPADPVAGAANVAGAAPVATPPPASSRRGVMGVVVPYVLDLFASVFKGLGPRFSAQVTQFEAIKAHAVESQVNGMIELIVGSLLLAVGIGLVRRRAWSARLSYVIGSAAFGKAL